MKIFLKIFKISILVFFIGLATLSVLGYMMRDRIIRMAVDKASETIQAPLGVEKVTFSLIKDFPQASMRFEGIWMAAPLNDSLENQSLDTLIKLQKFDVTLESKPLLDNIFVIRKVSMEDGYVKYLVDKNGGSSFDFLTATDTTATVEEDTTSAPLDLTLDELVLRNITSIYKDDALGARAKVHISQVISSLKMDSQTTRAITSGRLTLSETAFEGTNANRLKKADVDFDMRFESDTLTINDLKMVADDFTTGTKGKVAIGDEMYLDLGIKILLPSLANLSKYAPDDILQEYKIGQLAGAANVNAQVKGVYTDAKMPHYTASVNLSDASIRYEDYPLVYNVSMSAKANNGSKNENSTTAVELSNFHMDISGNQIDLQGSFRNLDRLQYNMKTKVALDLEASRSFIPDSLVQNVRGKVNLQMATSGVLPDSIDDQFVKYLMQRTQVNLLLDNVNLDMDKTISVRRMSGQLDYDNYRFDLARFKVYLPEYKLSLVNNSFSARLKGDVFNPEALDIDVPKFHLATPESFVKGSVKVSKLKNVVFSVQSKLDLDLAFLKQFAPDTLVNDMKGKVLVGLKSKGKMNLDKMEDDLMKIVADQTSIDIKFNEINLDMTDTLMNVQNLNGQIKLSDQILCVNDLSGSYSGIDFNVVNTTVTNLFNTVVSNKKGTLKVDGEYSFGDLDYAMLGAFMVAEESDAVSDATQEPSEPTNWNLDVRGKVKIKSFKYDSTTFLQGVTAQYQFADTVFEAKGKFGVESIKYGDALITDVSGLYNVKDSVYIVDQLNYKAFDGEGVTAMKIKMSGVDEMEIEMQNQVKKMNVRKMLFEMDNLYQDEITYENMSGVASTDNLFLRINFIGDSLIYPDMRMSGDITFEDGGIFNYPVITEMEQYVPYRLDTLLFNTVKSHIFIFKNSINVPQTIVQSSAFDMEVIGMQSFGDDYKYHAFFNLFQALKGKNDKKKKKEKGIWVVAYSEGRKEKNGLDNEGDRQISKNRIRTREASLKLTFHPNIFNFETNVEK